MPKAKEEYHNYDTFTDEEGFEEEPDLWAIIMEASETTED